MLISTLAGDPAYIWEPEYPKCLLCKISGRAKFPSQYLTSLVVQYKNTYIYYAISE